MSQPIPVRERLDPSRRRADLPKTGRGDAAAATGIVRGDGARRGRTKETTRPYVRDRARRGRTKLTGACAAAVRKRPARAADVRKRPARAVGPGPMRSARKAKTKSGSAAAFRGAARRRSRRSSRRSASGPRRAAPRTRARPRWSKRSTTRATTRSPRTARAAARRPSGEIASPTLREDGAGVPQNFSHFRLAKYERRAAPPRPQACAAVETSRGAAVTRGSQRQGGEDGSRRRGGEDGSRHRGGDGPRRGGKTGSRRRRGRQRGSRRRRVATQRWKRVATQARRRSAASRATPSCYDAPRRLRTRPTRSQRRSPSGAGRGASTPLRTRTRASRPPTY